MSRVEIAWGKIFAGVLVAGLCGMAAAEPKLLPAPREAHWGEAAPLPERITVVVPGRSEEDAFAAQDLRNFLGQPAEKPVAVATKGKAGRRRAPAAAAGSYSVVLLRSDEAEAKTLLAKVNLSFDAAMHQEGYVLVVGPGQTTIIGETGAGVFYGVATFKQLLPLAGQPRTIATGTVRDWPAMRYRGIQDDLSRGPFPTLEFQKHQIQTIAAYKANIYTPYFEHTLLYPNQPLAAPPGSAMTPADVKELVQFARQYHVTIIPEQEAFGHLHHVLKYDLYRDVAETSHGHVISPEQPGTLPLIKDWFTQIAAEFPSPFIHIGADETFDLGLGRTREAVEKKGYGPVYVEFLKQIHEELAPLHKRLLFWGDIGGDDPKAVPGLPKDMIAVPWNYWDTQGFTKMLEPFQKAGIETWVAPGDANWSEVYPVAKTALGNIQGFVREGQQMGSTGTINTVWNDDGEGLFNQDWYGVLFGAVAAWQPGESSIANYQEAYGESFHGDATGKIDEAEKELMAAHEALAEAKPKTDSDTVFWMDPWSERGVDLAERLLPVAPELRKHAERAIVLLAEAEAANPALRNRDAIVAMDLGARRLDLIGMKFELADEMAKAYTQAYAEREKKPMAKDVRAGLYQTTGANGRCEDLRDAYSAIKDQYSRVWLGENRPYWLGNVTVRYDMEIRKWVERGDAFRTAIYRWQTGKGLPEPETLGLPKSAH
ncbi:MAG: glycoside hydrolase family 20 zincin-like fold domain-containing protein [Terracidiphilus sp.]|nr:glycoside hydrolase family 20 zincin-like fold domain-containing protein [Terracidiphilus sp.]